VLASESYDPRTIVAARNAFLSEGREPAGVRLPVRRSWRRSRLYEVSTGRPEAPYHALHDEPDRLRLAAEPVMEHYGTILLDTNATIVLADRFAQIVSRRTGSRQLARVLDSSSIGTGFLYSEEFVGTNGLGTALTEEGPVTIRGVEHYAEALHPLTCVGTPIRHPVTRHLVGVVNIACPNEEVNATLLPMAIAIGREIGHRLSDRTYERERAMLERVLERAWGSGRPVIAITPRLVLANPAGARVLGRVDQALLWEQATHAVAAGATHVTTLQLAGRGALEVRCHPVAFSEDVTGAVIEIMDSPRGRARGHDGVLTTPPRQDALVGHSNAWVRAGAAAEAQRARALPVLLVGEPGVGKRSLARVIADGADGTVLDAGTEAVDGCTAWLRTVRDALASDDVVTVLHLDALSADAARGLAALLDAVDRDPPPRLIGTARTLASPARELVDRIGVVRIPVPALRERTDDVPALVEALARRHTGRPPRWQPAATQLLLRLAWPGNVRQLANVVRVAVLTARGHNVTIEDLPDDVRAAATRRRLTRIETLELEAIQAALQEVGGSKARAAEALGISRSTLYRRLRSYGLDLDHHVY
jgi:transcriptional regulator of acetoin/glycerol metabolism